MRRTAYGLLDTARRAVAASRLRSVRVWRNVKTSGPCQARPLAWSGTIYAGFNTTTIDVQVEDGWSLRRCGRDFAPPGSAAGCPIPHVKPGTMASA